MAELIVATLNLFNRMGEWDRRAPLVIDQLQALAPDIIGLQEVNLALDQGMWITRQINDRLPHHLHYRIKHAASPGQRPGLEALAVLSRLEPIEHEVLDLMTFDRVAQRLIFQTGERPFAFVNTHLHYPPNAERERVQQIEYLLAWLDCDPRRLPTVIAGDFNAYPEEKGVAVMKARFRSAHEAVHGREPEKTWSTPVNTFDPSPHGTLDYVYVSEQFRIVDAGLAFDQPAPEDPDLFPSDHLGVFARLAL
ncbi:MAG: endonuclease/exonuclease/phosphatase family protein [Chloroflexi bacterium]|nr:endonuclease/exonuclease/phosphatase family protein [Chloroflexota bacterium]